MSKSKESKPWIVAVCVCFCAYMAFLVLIQPIAPKDKPAPPTPAPIEIRPTPAVIPQPAPQPSIVVPKPRDIPSEPTAALLAEWNAWRHGPAPRTAEIQTIYEELLRRGVIRRDGEPVSESGGGRRKIGRRR